MSRYRWYWRAATSWRETWIDSWTAAEQQYFEQYALPPSCLLPTQ